MRETLVDIASRLKEAPEVLARLTCRRAEASDALHRALEEARRVEVTVAGEVAAAVELGRAKYPNDAARAAEVQRRLAGNQNYQRLQAEITKFREELRALDADLELAKCRFRADNNVIFLVACLVQASRQEDAEAVLSAYGAPREGQGQQAQPTAEAPQQARQADGLEAGAFTVLEARATDRGAVRAWCQAEDGTKLAIFGKNGTGQALANAVGKRVKVRFRRGDKGLIAIAVSAAAEG